VEQAEGLAAGTVSNGIDACRARIAKLRGAMEGRRRHFAATRLRAVDYQGGALAGRETIVELLETNLARLAAMLATVSRPS
jgi:hypothetical protein